VIIESQSSVMQEVFFEGNNKVNNGTYVNHSEIGFGTYIGCNCNIDFSKIGKFCSIANNVKIVVATHPTKKFVSTHPAFFSTRKQAGFTYTNSSKFDEIVLNKNNNNFSVIIGNDVWIGENVLILGGVTIGDGAIIGAGTIVTNDIDPYSINVGIPAKKINTRFNDEQIRFLITFQWWNKDISWIKNNADFFDDIERFMEEKK
jgi:acetyltransferase-like isoleucine patch superfamily enzyme